MSTLAFASRLLLALLLGASIGFERQWRQKSAGLRTNTLVCMGSAAFLLLSAEIGGSATGRIASYIISGIGFLGAGVIMKDGVSVRGLNTAATIWCSAAVGSMCGLGLYKEAVISTGAIILTHITLRPVGQILNRFSFAEIHQEEITYLLKVHCNAEVENHIRILLLQQLGNNDRLLLKSLSSDDDKNSLDIIISAEIKSISHQDSSIERTASLLTIEEKVSKVSWTIIGSESEI